MIIWQGPSELDGAPIVVIATKGSRNSKTGDMVQFWVLRSDMHPVDALHSCADESVCGDCKLRGGWVGDGIGRTCYVTPMALGSIYKCFKSGGYGEYVPGTLPGRGWDHLPYRFTAYGDPAAVPLAVWWGLLSAQVGHGGLGRNQWRWTGYTHRWRKLPIEWAQFFQASCDSQGESFEARRLGWSTFEVCEDTDGRVGAVECLHSATDGRVQCDRCLLCNGRSSVWVNVHGQGQGNFSDAVDNATAAEYVGMCDD